MTDECWFDECTCGVDLGDQCPVCNPVQSMKLRDGVIMDRVWCDMPGCRYRRDFFIDPEEEAAAYVPVTFNDLRRNAGWIVDAEHERMTCPQCIQMIEIVDGVDEEKLRDEF